MRYQVPQFIEIEDKIIGPFTLKQFLIYLGAVLALIPVFLLSDLSLFMTIAIPTMGAAVMFAHLTINGKTLFSTLLNAFGFFSGGQMYMWQRVSGSKPLKIIDQEWRELLRVENVTPTGVPSLTHMAQTLETQGNVVKAEEVEDLLAQNVVK